QHYKFNTFIAMFLIISEIYLFLFRTHVNLSSSPQKYPSRNSIFFYRENKKEISLLIKAKISSV
ncbi:hypothetical protein PL436_15675, partial [Phocaeicola vulgatus]|nr:hypothetical protein [Phocaeicola vulgatus]MDB0734317.1 hypothetical protein [Phocaeicola vulgatus]MDB0743320.1 hypothetical protein [Phocaeicola vulgatus]MDB0750044.1 hypothetical protein [Phocaeicola vulgatus]MDB0758173.1 hypothetical protein [Phocaeicola vulgatus]